MEDNIIVSVSCITYNHAKYIRQCLDGMLMQKTDFRYEILIHDDASTDGTDDIIREYETKYPDIIKPIYETENQYSKGIRISATYNYPRAKGKYIALCEGDDFWTDSRKLDRQVRFMEENTSCMLSAHSAYLIDAESNKQLAIKQLGNKVKFYDIKDCISGFGREVCTNTLMFRRCIIHNTPQFYETAPNGDYIIPIIASLHGDIAYLPYLMAAHRLLSSSSVTKSWLDHYSLRESYNIRYDEMLDAIDRFTQHRYSNLVEEEHFNLWFRTYISYDDGYRHLKEEPYKSKFRLLPIRKQLSIYIRFHFPILWKWIKLIYMALKKSVGKTIVPNNTV